MLTCSVAIFSYLQWIFNRSQCTTKSIDCSRSFILYWHTGKASVIWHETCSLSLTDGKCRTANVQEIESQWKKGCEWFSLPWSLCSDGEQSWPKYHNTLWGTQSCSQQLVQQYHQCAEPSRLSGRNSLRTLNSNGKTEFELVSEMRKAGSFQSQSL